MRAIQHFIHDESAITAIEYALLGAAIAVAIAAAAAALGANLGTVYTRITDLLT